MVTPAPTPPKFNMQDIIDILMMNQGKKGGTSATDLNFLNNDVFGALTGTANTQPELSEDEAFEQFMPTMMSLIDADPNSSEALILAQLEDGDSPISVKRQILELALPTAEQNLMLDLVDTISKEKADYTKWQRTPKEDAFTKMGLRHGDERFLPEDIHPEAFQGALQEYQTAQGAVDQRLGKISADYGVSMDWLKGGASGPAEMVGPGASTVQPTGQKGNLLEQVGQMFAGFRDEKPATPKKPGYEPTFTGDLLGDLVSNFQGSAKFRGKQNAASSSTQSPGMSAKGVDKAALQKQITARYLAELAGAPAPAMQGSIGDDMVWDSKTRQFRAPTGNEKVGSKSRTQATNLRDPVAAQANILQLISDGITADMEASAYTPANMDLLKRLLAAKGMKNG